MDFQYSDKVNKLCTQLSTFMDSHIVPRVGQYREEAENGQSPVSFLEDLKALARSEGLWNLFLPGLRDNEPGTRLSNLEYAPLAEMLGRIPWSSEVFNCNAPNTGNMELLHMFATPEQTEQWLKPMLDGKLQSAFAMTEPDVASSDATNIQTHIELDGDEYVINGRKWFISNACHPDCRLMIVMGKTDPDSPKKHKQQSMVLVPMETKGVTVVRNISVMNHLSTHGHCEVVFKNVRVPRTNLLGGEGEGFALAQARLGPGRIHHCMRSIGQMELALMLMTERAQERKTFGKSLFEHGAVAEWIARSRIDIEQARLLVLKAAWMIDEVGAKQAAKEISMIKALVPSLHTQIVDRAIQTFGAMGVSPDSPLPDMWSQGRYLRFADGPDEVHLQKIARMEISESRQSPGRSLPYLFTPDRT